MNTHAVEANVAPPAGLLVAKMHPPRLRGAASSRRRLASLSAGESHEAIVREARFLG